MSRNPAEWGPGSIMSGYRWQREWDNDKVEPLGKPIKHVGRGQVQYEPCEEEVRSQTIL